MYFTETKKSLLNFYKFSLLNKFIIDNIQEVNSNRKMMDVNLRLDISFLHVPGFFIDNPTG